MVLVNPFMKNGGVDLLLGRALRRYIRLGLPVLASVLISYVLLWQNLYLNNTLYPLTQVRLGRQLLAFSRFQAPPRFVKGCTA